MRSLSRRHLLKGGLAGATMVAFPSALVSRPQGSGSGDLVLHNGKFIDGSGVVASTIIIKNGRIVSVGPTTKVNTVSQTIDLGGRTVIPGLFDAHAHYTRAAMNPGHEARRIERAF